MRYIIAAALAATSLATPAIARDHSWYAGIEAGLEAEIAFKAYPGRIFQAKVETVQPIIAEGDYVVSGQLQSATAASAAGYVPVVFSYGDDIEAGTCSYRNQAMTCPSPVVEGLIVKGIKEWHFYKTRSTRFQHTSPLSNRQGFIGIRKHDAAHDCVDAVIVNG